MKLWILVVLFCLPANLWAHRPDKKRQFHADPADSSGLSVQLLVFAQNPQLRTRVGSRFPTIVFTSVLWRADPSFYSIAIDSTGTATYQSAPDLVTRTGVPYTVEFHVTDRTRRTTFNIARELGFFAEPAGGVVNSAESGPVRTLSYNDSQLHNQITYSSSNGDLEELTSVFEDISETLEFGRRLNYFYRTDKSALGRELDALQKQQEHRPIRELHAIDPTLRQIASDRQLSTDVRSKAEALLNASPHS